MLFFHPHLDDFIVEQIYQLHIFLCCNKLLIKRIKYKFSEHKGKLLVHTLTLNPRQLHESLY